MAEANWHNLPQHVQLEIFSFLSVKHLGKVLSLNKSIHQQLDESEYFWQELCENYARIIDPALIEKIKTLANDESLSIHDKYSNRFKVMIETKKKKIEIIKMKSLVFKQRKQLEKLRALRMQIYQNGNNVEEETNNDSEDESEQEIAKLQFD